jgi:hypothetical protein
MLSYELTQEIFNDRKLATIGIYDSYKQNYITILRSKQLDEARSLFLNATKKFSIIVNWLLFATMTRNKQGYVTRLRHRQLYESKCHILNDVYVSIKKF